MVVYLITNTINGKRYIGWTSRTLEWRWKIHQTRKTCPALRSAIDKYGATNFSVEALTETETKKEAQDWEREFIVRYNSRPPWGYNLTSGGDGVPDLSEETRKRRAMQLLGNKYASGIKRSPEYIADLRERMKGRVFSKEARERMAFSASIKQISSEGRAKYSESAKQRGIRPPQHSKEKLAEIGLLSCHKRYHIARNIVNPKCKLCCAPSPNSVI